MWKQQLLLNKSSFLSPIQKLLFKKTIWNILFMFWQSFCCHFSSFHFCSFKNHKTSRVRGPCWENNCSLFPTPSFSNPLFFNQQQMVLIFSSFGSYYSRNFLQLDIEVALQHNHIYVVFTQLEIFFWKDKFHLTMQ